ncbi:MAG: hypothetical protein RID11_06730 [Roseovarius sp.]|jgi:hypothetical protein|uniref:hypothetical protein n=1 Tax=Roseovarius sp. TaxID=1486281 RepID=UPI0032EEA95F
MSQVSEELKEKFRVFVECSNPTSLHALDEGRLYDCLVDLFAEGHDVDEHLIASIWPSKTLEGLGGDPAKSDYVRRRAEQAANVAGQVLKKWSTR